MSKPYSTVRLGTHWFIKKSELRKPLDQLRRLFTVTPKFVDEDTREVLLYTEDAEWFGVPRHYADMGRQAEEVVYEWEEGACIDMQFTSELRPRQVPVHDRVVQLIALDRLMGLLLGAPTGTGKTVMALDILSLLNRTALVVVPRNRIVDQWCERIIEHTNLTAEDVGIAQQSRCDFRGKKIVVGMIHSLVKDKYPEEFKRHFGVVLVDEVHVTGAETFSQVLSMYPSRYRIGLSATLDRKDGMEEVFKLTMGQTTLTMTGTTDVTPKVFMRPYKTKAPVNPYLKQLKDRVKRRGVIISELAKDLARNALLAVYVQKSVASGRRTLVLSDRTEQLDTLRDLLVHRHRLVPAKVGIFTGATPKKERERVLQVCDVILATYGVMAMAIDVPDLKSLVFGTPMSDVRQATGRILRLSPGTKEPVVFDVVDTAFNDCQRWAALREQFYRQNKAQIVQVQPG